MFRLLAVLAAISFLVGNALMTVVLLALMVADHLGYTYRF